ncbi:NAD(P)/FAD-dependent oxidoreductase, partial [Acinetobacter baumannii]
DLAMSDLTARVSAPRQKRSMSTYLRKAAGLSPVAIGLLQEAAIAVGVNLSAMSSKELAAFINAVPIKLTGVAAVARAISTAGGVSFNEIDAN